MKKVAIVIAVLVAVFVGVGGILPALAKVRDIGAIPSAFVVSYTSGFSSSLILAVVLSRMPSSVSMLNVSTGNNGANLSASA